VRRRTRQSAAAVGTVRRVPWSSVDASAYAWIVWIPKCSGGIGPQKFLGRWRFGPQFISCGRALTPYNGCPSQS
jgi:hypothetical protein